MIKFRTTGRGRSIVLTRHQIDALSKQVGRQVEADLLVIARAGPVEARTMGKLMRWLRLRLQLAR